LRFWLGKLNSRRRRGSVHPRTWPGVEALEPRTLLDTATTQFITQLYQDFLHRPPDPGGLGYFSSFLDQKIRTRAQVGQMINDSAEAHANQVQDAYNQFLHRSADPGGLTFFTNFLGAGGSIQQLDAMMAGSEEYFSTRGGGTTNGFLDALYQDVLARGADAGGLAFFANALAQGTGRQIVANSILGSPEADDTEVRSLVNHFYHRQATDEEVARIGLALRLGLERAELIGGLVGAPEYAAGGAVAAASSGQDPLTEADVQSMLATAAGVSASNDAIIAIVDRGGNILGVRVEGGVAPPIMSDPQLRTFAIDGAVALARTGAFFANDRTPLTSRTIQFVSQSTITQRDVNSNPNVPDPNSTARGPGFVAPIGTGGHFPPGVSFTPQVDLFEIEHTNRDSIDNPGPDHIKGTADDITLPSRFNVDPAFIPAGQEISAPESYGYVSGVFPAAQSRGIGTLPGGMPIYKNGVLVGGIGVFFPGKTGFASEENSALSADHNPALPDRSLEAEYIAFQTVKNGLAPVLAALPGGRIDLVGITLDVIGPGGTQGLANLLAYGATLAPGNSASGIDVPVDTLGHQYLDGKPVPEGWLVTPHDGVNISAADVTQIVNQGIAQANVTRAAIRPLGSTASMVFTVTDTTGAVLGMYRMHDAAYFSIDVATAKARNVDYYADPAKLQPIDLIAGVPPGVAFTNRTFRYVAEPRYPDGIDGRPPGPFSELNDGGANPGNGLAVSPPLPASAFQSAVGYDAFNPDTNFHETGNIANQNGVVFFPGSTPLYKIINGVPVLVAGFGVSGDGVDQDDVVTAVGATGYAVPAALRADMFFVRGARLPFQKFDRNPEG
jgi:uncharacterized protein GlcG (DUF336 family)